MPLDYDYNAYWPCTSSDLNYWSWQTGFTAAAGFTPTTTGDGTTDAGHDITLSVAPAYQSGPFGAFYLPTSSPTYNAGSQPAANAGLYHYTTRLDQTKEGDEASGHMVNIGLHYIAATSSTTAIPKDTDGDGIPDYVEDSNGNGVVDANETDWTTQYTASGVFDPTNSVYDDIDLSGDGLVGRIKKAFGMNPFETSNPFTVMQVTTGEEPNIVTFSLPLAYNSLSNVGTLDLVLDGTPVTLSDASAAADGSTVITWNTTFEPGGPHCLQELFSFRGDGGPTGKVEAFGALTPFYSPNVLQFLEAGGFYSAGTAYLDAQLSVMYANYTIQVFDPSTTPETPLYSVTNSSYTGAIQENWGVTNSDGSPFTGQSAHAVFTVTPQDEGGNPLGAPSQYSRTLTRAPDYRDGEPNYIDFAYFYTPSITAIAREWDDPDGIVTMGMGFVVNTLLMPNGDYTTYNSTFDAFDEDIFLGEYEGYAGYLISQFGPGASVAALLTSLGDGNTHNFYCYGHGDGAWMGSSSAFVPNPEITAGDVSQALTNIYDTRKGALSYANPYRFVFLDGCATASTPDWRHAFGIVNGTNPTNGPTRSAMPPQAFVGWTDEKTTGLGGTYPNGIFNLILSQNSEAGYTDTLNYFFFQWMTGKALATCIINCMDREQVQIPFPDARVRGWWIPYGDPGGNLFWMTNQSPGRIIVQGHSGLWIGGLDTTQDNKLQ